MRFIDTERLTALLIDMMPVILALMFIVTVTVLCENKIAAVIVQVVIASMIVWWEYNRRSEL